MKKALVSLILFLFPMVSMADVTYTCQTKSWTDKKKTPVLMSIKTFIKAPACFRTEFDSVDNPMMNKDTYWISKDGVNVFIINNKEKSYQKVNLNDMAKFSSSLMQSMGQLMQITIENPSVKQTRGDQDVTVAGMPAKHYIVTMDYVSKMKMAFIKTVTIVHSVKNLWIAPSFTEGIKDSGAGQNVKSGFPDLDKLIDAEMVKIPGAIVKSSTVTENKNEKGDVEKSYADYEITTINKDNVASSLFEIPAGYTEAKVEQTQDSPKNGSDTKKDDNSNPMNKLKGLFGN